MYNEKREGTRIEPCGTPQVRWATEDEKLPRAETALKCHSCSCRSQSVDTKPMRFGTDVSKGIEL